MGRKLVLTGTTLTDLSAPKLADIDPIESAGSLLLVEASHPKQQWAAGVPADLATVPNLFAANASARGIVGSTAPVVRNVMTTPSNGLVERTGRGGVHVILTAANAPVAEQGFELSIPDALAEFARTSGHAFYVSQWLRVTRQRASTNSLMQAPTLMLTNSAQDSNYYLARFADRAGSRPTVGLGTHFEDLVNAGTPATLGVKRLSVGASGWVGTVPTSATNMQKTAFRVGRRSGWASAAAEPGSASFVHYRTYIEDLTISGRTYAQVDAIDAQLHAAAFSVGGRYYGDTFTNPTTVA